MTHNKAFQHDQENPSRPLLSQWPHQLFLTPEQRRYVSRPIHCRTDR